MTHELFSYYICCKKWPNWTSKVIYVLWKHTLRTTILWKIVDLEIWENCINHLRRVIFLDNFQEHGKKRPTPLPFLYKNFFDFFWVLRKTVLDICLRALCTFKKKSLMFVTIFFHISRNSEWKYTVFWKVIKAILYSIFMPLNLFCITCHHQN